MSPCSKQLNAATLAFCFKVKKMGNLLFDFPEPAKARPILVAALVCNFLLSGCQEQNVDYIAASSITDGGLLRNSQKTQIINGQEIKVWGFVDTSNLYGNDEVKAVLKEWWGGYGPTSSTWSFNLKAQKNDKAGHSFQVTVPNDQGRDHVLETILADARAQRSTKVHLTGKVYTFAMPTNFANYTGLYMKLASSEDILLHVVDGPD